MAKWFAAKGYQVSMLTWDEGQEDGVEINGVRVFKMCRKEAGIKGLRFFWPKWTSLWQAMGRANAHVYYYNCGDLGLGQIVMWCRRYRRRSVYSVASNPDCDPKLPVLKSSRERLLYRHGLKQVDTVLVQSQHQQQMLREGFGINSTIIPMPCPGIGWENGIRLGRTGKGPLRVLWIGRISEEKRLELLLDVAEQLPELTFDVVGASNTDSDYASALLRRATQICNVKIHGRIPHAKIGTFYERCCVLCCTSAYEGFPNTFLEAWSTGIPVVSTYDPDGVIVSNRLGYVAQDVNSLAAGLRKITQSSDTWLRASRAAKQYYRKNHRPEICLPKFERVFLEISGYRS